ncbi:TPA: NAD-dependent epimerase/dehydratase family protein, partial [archaeon]|nr:NAD-dependent epimerase/dehydratase family protein [Candidatus Naiadarchaeales archaeon SRR2090153.bin1042]
MTKFFITGGAGFIGSHLVDELISNHENSIVVYDDLSSGKRECIKHHFLKKNFRFVKGDLLDLKKLKKAARGSEFVYHLAANPDIQYGIKNTKTDLEQNTIATYNILEAMRLNKIEKIAFASTSAIYGEPKIFPTPEDYGPLLPISLYGASKLACESLVTAYCGTFGFQSWILRFANIIGPRSTHGVIFDFISKLKKNKNELEILGDGNQKKSYLHVYDLIEGMQFAIENSNNSVNVFNLGSDDQIIVKEIANILIKE